MKKTNIPLMATLLALSIIVCPILYFTVGPKLEEAQLDALKHWIGIDPNRASDTLLKDLTRNSYEIVKAKYTKKKNISLP
jgi:hypothetical protein